MKIERIPPGWGGFSGQYGCWFLDPLDPKFKEIQVKFLQEQQKEYGTSHYYGDGPVQRNHSAQLGTGVSGQRVTRDLRRHDSG